MKTRISCSKIINFLFVLLLSFQVSSAQSEDLKDSLYHPGILKSTDSSLLIKVGDAAPDFSLPDLKGGKVSLGDFKGKQNVVLSFVPAAWTPVCSQQWPGYNLVKDIFDENNATLIGITVDNIPTLHAWTRQMGNLWFHVASDFWPHGEVARKYGILRSDGVSERATVLIDKNGVVSYVEVHDINAIPRLEDLVKELSKLPK
ncbi:MAG: peroxiredoxin [Syntrophaceae bacterium]|nr:peroxiredoxin [Syntrophaceae bacterium]